MAGAPVDALLTRGDELAQRWAAALILARPLQQIGELPLERFAREAPALCGQVARALSSDVELERMAPGRAAGGHEQSGWARALVAVGGARDAGSAIEVVEALRGVLWEALLEELRAPSAREVAELGDRLAYICATALATALAGTAGAIAASAAGQDPGADAGELGALGSGRRVRQPESPAAGGGAGVLIDEREDIPLAPEDGAGSQESASPTSGRGPRAQPLPWELPSGGAEPPIAIRDERREEGPAAWIGSIGRQLERFAQDELPFAVLLVDLGDIERSSGDALSGGAPSLARQVEHALEQELHVDGHGTEVHGWPRGSLTCERPGRYWLLAPETDAVAARTLAESIVRAIRPLTASRWPRPEVTVGTAVCPDDGRDAAALAACADIGIYTARRAGRSSSSVDEPA